MELEQFQANRSVPSAKRRNVRADECLVSADPWADWDAGQERRDNWMLSYVDILTLMLTLFVLLLVLQPKYETPMSGQVPELAELSSSTFVEQHVVETPEGRAMEARSITSQTGIPFHGETLALLAEPEVSEAVGGIELAIVGEKVGISTSASSETFEESKQSSESRIETTTVDSQNPSTAVPAKVLNRPDGQLSETHEERPQASATETILAELDIHGLDSHLEVSQVAAGMQLEVSDTILFAEGSAQLKLEGQKVLSGLAQVLLKHQGMISVEGHTDNRPISSTKFPSNWELSSSRATTVTRHLISHGLDPTTLRTVGYADTRPLDTNATSEGRTRNRRVSLVLESVRDR